MDISSSNAGQSLQKILHVRGEVDLYSAIDFQKTVEREWTGTSHVLLDFSQVDYLDSSGVGALIRLLQKSKPLGLKLAMAGLGGTPLKVLQMCNVVSLIQVFASNDQAQDFFEG